MARTERDDREQIVGMLAVATERISLATASLGLAYEQLDEMTADRLEAELFRPVQRALARAKRTNSEFAQRFGLDSPAPGDPSAGAPSQGAQRLIENAVAALGDAARDLAELQDTMLPIEVGDADLRAGLAEVRELVDAVPSRARGFLRTLGR
ncbi:MAG TPA: hypothetical protein VHF58_10350 [Solirubrobacterales bacterium]|nr:hypothetical protein [Solirubrobacterales bacterium]